MIIFQVRNAFQSKASHGIAPVEIDLLPENSARVNTYLYNIDPKLFLLQTLDLWLQTHIAYTSIMSLYIPETDDPRLSIFNASMAAFAILYLSISQQSLNFLKNDI